MLLPVVASLVSCDDGQQSGSMIGDMNPAADAGQREAAFNPDLPPLPIEELGHVMTLPASYPQDWVMVDEVNFFNMSAGKMIVLDIAETEQSKRIKGMVDKSFIGNFTQAKSRSVFYIIESFHERGSRGKRQDYLTVYDKRTLQVIREIPWPSVRLQALPERYSMALSPDEKFLYVSNFSPAASVTVVDLDRYAITANIDTPGCVLTYPSGRRGITSICSNGGFLSTVIDDKGKLLSRHRMDPVFDPDTSPIFERPAIVDDIAYFPGFAGTMHMLDLRDNVAVYRGSWDMLTAREHRRHYRPSGLALIDKDDQGLVYIIMQPDGHEGSHQHGGNQVWVYDVRAKKRVSMIAAPNHALSLALTRGKSPRLVITNADMQLDVIDPVSGTLIQTITDFGQVTPLLVHKSY